MRRSTRTTLLIAVVVVVLIAVLVVLREKAPPEVARLLPESDAVLYLDLKPIRAATHFDKTQTPHDVGYQHFIDATGFEFERDLNEAAFALNRMPDPHGPNGVVAYTEVFAGHFDAKRLSGYLKSISTGQETYLGHTIFSVPSNGRMVRVAILSYDMVAASNTPTPEQIHSILDRYRTAALPFAGSSLLSEMYGKVPAFSLAWAIGRAGPETWKQGGPKVFGVRIPLTGETTFIGSVRWLGSAKLRVEELAPDPASAEQSASTVAAFLMLAKGAENVIPTFSKDDDLRTLLHSTRIDQKGSQAVLTATIPTGLLKQLAAAPDKLSGATSPGK
jgi:hypothetical protein